jgi:CRISPR system Cascade subunit CasD
VAEYLIFRLYGPLASWGEIAMGESRHSATHPSRSALLGLLGSALGITRDDEAGQQQLFASFRFGVKLVTAGTPLRDYHTVQVPPQKGKAGYRTRQQELANRSSLGTLLSSREYRCDSLAIVAAEALPGAAWPLQHVADALRKPKFMLYLGRKSCVLALPLGPVVMDTPTLREALDAPQTSLSSFVARNAGNRLMPKEVLLQQQPEAHWPTGTDKALFDRAPARYFWEDKMEFGQDGSMQQVRNDDPLSRTRWQFAARREWVYLDRSSQKEGQ